LDGLSDDLQSLFLGPAGDVSSNTNSTSSLPSLRREARHVRRHSWDEDQTESKPYGLVEDSSEWSAWERSKDDLFLDSRRSSPRSNRRRLRSNAERSKPVASTAGNDYQYQICLFIQMQLCTSITLADWIRDRNENCGGEDQRTESNSRLDVASQIFLQLAQGLAHVHHKGIIHRYV
jgi:serine/threonine protein kinase